MITGCQDENVAFIFYQSESPFRQVTMFKVKKDHHIGGFLVNERRAEENRTGDFILTTMYFNQSHNEPCKIVKFTRKDTEMKEWNEP